MNLRIQSALAFPPLKAPPSPLRPLPSPPPSTFHSWRSLSSVVSPFPPLVAMYNWRRQFVLVDEAIPYPGIVTAKQTRTRIAGNVCRLISAATRAYTYTCTEQQFPRTIVTRRSRISIIIRTEKQQNFYWDNNANQCEQPRVSAFKCVNNVSQKI